MRLLAHTHAYACTHTHPPMKQDFLIEDRGDVRVIVYNEAREKSVPEKTCHEVLHRCWKALTILAYQAKRKMSFSGFTLSWIK